MSLYALFPGNDPLTSRQPPTTTTSSSGGGTTCNNPSLYRPASPVSATEFGARCVVLDISTMKTGKRRQINRSDSFSTTDTTEALSKSSSSSLQESHTTTTTAATTTTTTTTIKHDQQLKIQVENIKINFNKLCRAGGKSSFSCHDSSKSNNKTKRSFSVSRSPKDGRLRRRSRCNTLGNSSAASENLSSYEKAIEFDLNIRYGGRSYVAKRSLNQIAQLRQDLLEEMAYHHHAMDHLLDESSTGSSDLLLDDSYRSSISSSSCSSITSTSCEKVIPALPRLSSETVSAGSLGGFGGGFAQINGMMQAYRPALESWFQQTTTSATSIVSEDNPVLANFLWEPLSSSSSSSLLGSMHEI